MRRTPPSASRREGSAPCWWRLLIALPLAALALAQTPAPLPVLPQTAVPVYHLNIPRQELDTALKDLADQTHLQIARFSDTRGTPALVGPLVGDFTVEQALRLLLASSGLTYRFINQRTLAISLDEPPPSRIGSTGPTHASASAATEQPTALSRRSDAPATAIPDVESEVTVTGTRIRQPNGSYSPTPVTIVDSEELRDLHSGNLIDSLSLLPQFLLNSTPQNAFNFASNAGQSFLNLRGLGPNRTLVLLDGRRVVSSSRLGSTDIATLPAALIKRIEVVTGGASAAYGSDAVSGVANLVLDTSFNGLKMSAEGGVTSRGDNDSLDVSVAGGAPLGDTAHFIASMEYLHSDRIETYAGRNWFQGWGRVTNPQWLAAGTGPQALILPHVTSTRYTFGGLINQPGSALDRLMFLPDGSTTAFVAGNPAIIGTGCYCQSGGIGDNYEADRTGDGSLIPAVVRGNAFAYLDWEPVDDLKVYGQVLYGVDHVDFVNVGAVQFGQWQATIYRDNPFLPDNVRQTMSNEGLASFGFSRMASSADLGRARDLVQNETLSLTSGFESERGRWRLAGYYQFGRNLSFTTLKDFVRTDRLSLALDAVPNPASGQIECRSTLYKPTNGCVPIDLFGVGRASQQALDYVLGNKYGWGLVEQQFAELSADGELFAGFGAGPVRLAYGASFRNDRFRQHASPDDSLKVPPNDPSQGIQGIPAAFVGSFIYQFSSFPDLGGSFSVKEAFAETEIPLLAHADGSQRLELSLASRFADYSGSGGIWAWKAGLNWLATQDLTLRATVSRDTRAANLSERFDGTNHGGTVRDPLFNNTVFTLSTTSTGNPAVRPERADTYTVGALYQPHSIDGLSVSLEWYSISIRDAIAQLGAQSIVNGCYAGSADLCALITRSADTNEIVFIRDEFLNAALAKAVGADLDIQYARTLQLLRGGPETLNLRMLASWLGENSIIMPSGIEIDRAGQTGGGANGSAAFPNLQITAYADYRNGPWKLYLQEHFINKGKLDATLRQGIDISDNSVASVLYTDLLLSYKLQPRRAASVEIFWHIENLFNRDPPRAPDYSDFNGASPTNESLFDVLGRRYTLGVRATF